MKIGCNTFKSSAFVTFKWLLSLFYEEFCNFVALIKGTSATMTAEEIAGTFVELIKEYNNDKADN
ncbi:MAG: hypothetical protein IJ604_14530 [Prevotella sp.]|nr:hypothetical protein [Prevotella sp.]